MIDNLLHYDVTVFTVLRRKKEMNFILLPYQLYLQNHRNNFRILGLIVHCSQGQKNNRKGLKRINEK